MFIGLNEDCWLGINGVKSQYGGQNYIDAIKAEVVRGRGQRPLSGAWGFSGATPGAEVANSSDDPNGGGQPPLPDNDHAPLFWEEVADTFKSDPNVIFRLQEEPHPAGNSSGSSAWTCWSQGDVQYSPSSVKALWHGADADLERVALQREVDQQQHQLLDGGDAVAAEHHPRHRGYERGPGSGGAVREHDGLHERVGRRRVVGSCSRESG